MSTAVSTLTIALAGNPNSGKTTIFNALTGLRQKVANYPGVTVEKKVGRTKLGEHWADVIDLPGTYSLISRSPDEQVAMEVLRGLRADTPPPDVVVCVVDASNIQRNLYLVSQLIELGRPLVIALNMMDIAERRGMHISASRLSSQLGVPVVAIVGHQRKGISDLKSQIANAAVAPMPKWDLPDQMSASVHALSDAIEGSGFRVQGSGIRSQESEVRSQESGVRSRELEVRSQLQTSTPVAVRPDSNAIAERLLIGDRALDIAHLVETDPIKSVLNNETSRLHQLGIDPMQADIEAHYKWIDQVTSASLVPACEVLTRGMGFQPMLKGAEHEGRATTDSDAAPHGLEAHATAVLDYAPRLTFTDKLDRIFLHKFLGLTIFALIMAALFVSIFWIADPIMGAVESGIAHAGRYAAGFLPEGPLQDLWNDGIVAGVGGVLVFVPQIALLFLFLAILEDSGYLARAAFLMDRVLSKVGLHGKSFIPLLSSFACAIPGIMAARTIECRRDRLATIFVAPFMSCSARLPVYALLIGAFFASFSAMTRGGILLGLYALGIFAAFATAFLFKIGAKREAPTSFILELPTYKRPQLSQIARVVWTNTWAFVSKAGTIIFCLSVVLWGLMYYPRLPEADESIARSEVAAGFRRTHPQQSITLAGQTVTFQTGFFDSDGKPIKLIPIGNETLGFQTIEEATAQAVASAQLRHSYAGRLGHLIEPAIKPLGYDWKMGIGLISAFAAREVFVSTMGIVYAAGDTEEDDTTLREAMMADRYADGRPVWTPLVAASLLVFFVLAMQCMSTLAIVRRETGSWKWPMLQLLYMTGLAYVASLAVYQIGRAFIS